MEKISEVIQCINTWKKYQKQLKIDLLNRRRADVMKLLNRKLFEILLREIIFQHTILSSPSLSFTLLLFLLSVALFLTLILHPPLTQVHSKWLQMFYFFKFFFEFYNCVPLFVLKEFSFKKERLKEILKAGCCFLVSCTIVSSTHGYMIRMLIQLNLYELCNFYRSMYIMLSENICFWLIVLLCRVDTQEKSCKDNAKFNFLGIIWYSKTSWRVIF